MGPGQERTRPGLRSAGRCQGPEVEQALGRLRGRHRDASRPHQSRAREVADSQRSAILKQVENDIAVRIFVLEKVIG